jgi:hypothetical protein
MQNPVQLHRYWLVVKNKLEHFDKGKDQMMSRGINVLGATVAISTAFILVVLMSACSSGSNSQIDAARFGVATARAAEPIGEIGTSASAAAIENAGKADKYIFTMFYRTEDAQTESVRAAIKSARENISRKSETVEVNITDPAELELVKKFNVGRTTMPLALVLAPNGAIMGGFPGARVNEQVLVDAVGTRASEQTVKAIQEKNMVVLCAQSRGTSDNEAAMQGVEEFLKDPQYAGKVAVVSVDPTDPAEAKFLSQIKLNTGTNVATTALIAPPGTVVASFEGATKKDQFVAAVKAASAPKSGGCCPPGSGKTCGPATGAAPAPQKKMASTTVKASPTPTTISAQKQSAKTSPSSARTSTSAKQETKKGK